LDLGGSSTQIAVPPENAEGLPHLGGYPSTVRSYAAYGMEQMRDKLDHLAATNGWQNSPCYFKGYTVESHDLKGSGDALNCRKMLLEIFSEAREQCKDAECMPGSDAAASKAGGLGMQFYAVSGYLYVTDFASYWLQRGDGGAAWLKNVGNRPTVDELEQIADMLCRSDWAEIERAHAGGKETGAHRYTGADKAPHRCLEVNYVATLLRHSYGFPGDQRLVTFEDEVDGNDVEWPLGALLHMRHENGVTSGGNREEL